MEEFSGPLANCPLVFNTGRKIRMLLPQAFYDLLLFIKGLAHLIAYKVPPRADLSSEHGLGLKTIVSARLSDLILFGDLISVETAAAVSVSTQSGYFHQPPSRVVPTSPIKQLCDEQAGWQAGRLAEAGTHAGTQARRQEHTV